MQLPHWTPPAPLASIVRHLRCLPARPALAAPVVNLDTLRADVHATLNAAIAAQLGPDGTPAEAERAAYQAALAAYRKAGGR